MGTEGDMSEEAVMDGEALYAIRRVATSGCDIRDPDGLKVAWAALIAFCLNRVEEEGLGSLFGIGDEPD